MHIWRWRDKLIAHSESWRRLVGAPRHFYSEVVSNDEHVCWKRRETMTTWALSYVQMGLPREYESTPLHVRGHIVPCTPLHLFNSFSYFSKYEDVIRLYGSRTRIYKLALSTSAPPQPMWWTHQLIIHEVQYINMCCHMYHASHCPNGLEVRLLFCEFVCMVQPHLDAPPERLSKLLFLIARSLHN